MATEQLVRQATIEGWRAGLEALHARIGGRFRRRKCGSGLGGIWRGLLEQVERKNGWQLAERLGEPDPGACSACWRRPAGMPTRSATTCGPTWSSTSATRRRADRGRDRVPEEGDQVGRGGPAVQRDGRAHRELSGRGVPRPMPDAAGRAFLDRALYLPKAWAMMRPGGRRPAVPEDGRGSPPSACSPGRCSSGRSPRGVPVAWVVGDTVFWLGEQQASAQTVVARVPADAWTQLSAGDGSQGPRWYDWAWIPLAGDCPPGLGTVAPGAAEPERPAPTGLLPGLRAAETPLAETVRGGWQPLG